ncbi:MAG: cyclopropane-fatty-acyl-phospholipid synthase family protein [Alphaproteobacteria bacterium]|nr:cyclopropane-fatty-acyl-phospholipid synthase family protein [Alphaproteobacteria bacterium]
MSVTTGDSTRTRARGGLTLDGLLSRGVRRGRLEVIDWRGDRRKFGSGGDPRVVVRLHDRSLAWRLFCNPWLAVGEAYVDGTLTVEEGTVYDLVDLAMVNFGHMARHPVQQALTHIDYGLRWLRQWNPIGRAQRNVAHHYDLSRELFALFLDDSLQYSCAYFAHPGMSLEQAQCAKLRHIAAKLRLKPGMRVLDIGSGWGALGFYLAEVADVEVLGVTLSKEQLDVARARAEERGLADRVRFELSDYRLVRGRFDRIVSVGMFEHVGVRHYDEFFGHVERLLNSEGVALLHAIGRRDGPGVTNPWIRKYIFPGGYIPALSEVLTAVEHTGLWTTDVEILRLHYAETLSAWRRNFEANRKKITRLYDERFCRMWEFYLVGSEASFRRNLTMVFQMQLSRSIDALPLTRNYMIDGERRLARQEGLRTAAE